MYLWLGIDVEDQLAAVRQEIMRVEREIPFAHSVLTLPLHISLKITFSVPVGMYEPILNDVAKIYRQTASFPIAVRGTECFGGICWIRMERNAALDGIHDRLNDVLLSAYGVPLHTYDTDYRFHTTLFMDDDAQKVHRAYEAFALPRFPSELIARRFVIGRSETGALGSFHVVRRIDR